MQKNLKKGFTLIELLVVIAIIGILSSVVLVSLNSARQKARDSSRKSNLQQLMTAMSLYSDAFNSAAPVANLAAACATAAGEAWEGWDLNAATDTGCPTVLAPTYIPRIPTDTIQDTYGYRNGLAAGGGGSDVVLTTFCATAELEGTPADAFLCTSSGCLQGGDITGRTCTEA